MTSYSWYQAKFTRTFLDLIANPHKNDNVPYFLWPDGGSTHMDLRLVGASVTQVFVSKPWAKTKKLYYLGMPSHLIEDEERKKLAGVDSTFLNMRITYSDKDAKKAMEALKCHTSQVSPEMIKRKEESSKKK